jgi:hypothetical protein
VVSKRRWALPAASFFTEGHLIHRMRLLVAGPNRFSVRLCLSYAAVAFLLTAAMWGGFIWFPLVSQSFVVLAAQPKGQHIIVRATDPPGHVVRFTIPREFTVAVPPPTDGKGDVMYFVHSGSVVQPAGALFIQPPPLPLPIGGPIQFGFPAVRGIRMVRPGEIATPEEIQRLREAIGANAEVEIDQAENGFVRRVSVYARRLSDEADTVRSLVAPDATEPSTSGDRVD